MDAAALTRTGTATTAQAATGATSRQAIAQNFDSFLLLLTTQLKNQNPLEPLDTNQFTQQLVQFASVEQQLKTNDTLGALLNSSKAQNATNAAAFMGKTVTADGATTQLSGGSAKWVLNAPRAAADAVVTIRDSKGNIVFQDRGTLAQGANTYSWDGRTNANGTAPDGDYQITVTARDVAGQDMTVKSEISGKVTGVDLSGETPVLLIGATRVSIDTVKSVSG